MWLIAFNLVAVAWIVYRVFFAKAFLLWDWSDGKIEYVWNKGYWR